MEQMNFHKQKLYALIAAGIALVSLLLPWVNLFYSLNGFRGWGILSLVGIAAVGAITFMGDKAADYTTENKKYVMIAFGAVALGALLFMLRKNAVYSEFAKTGIGLWICLAAGLGGLALIYGLIKIENKKPV